MQVYCLGTLSRCMRRALFGFVLLCLLTVAGVVAYDVCGLVYRPMPANASITAQPLILCLEKNMSAANFVHTLARNDLIQSPRLFLLMIRLQGLSHLLKAGIYQIKPGETAYLFLKRVVDGDCLRLPFQIIEGTTLNNTIDVVDHLPYLLQNKDVMAKIAGDHASAEGLLLADTYYYDAGSNALNVLMTAHNALTNFLDKAWVSRSENLPYKSSYELLIAASIIEKESAKADEKRLISGVIVNRLQKRMQLQMDPTVIYALGSEYTGTLTHQNLSVDSPYNTYKHYGLPPTPIAMVAKDSIDAAAHPAITSYLYFVARGDGTHQFSESYEDQRKAISTLKDRKK